MLVQQKLVQQLVRACVPASWAHLLMHYKDLCISHNHILVPAYHSSACDVVLQAQGLLQLLPVVVAMLTALVLELPVVAVLAETATEAVAVVVPVM
jgi:hypothetical protein